MTSFSQNMGLLALAFVFLWKQVLLQANPLRIDQDNVAWMFLGDNIG